MNGGADAMHCFYQWDFFAMRSRWLLRLNTAVIPCGRLRLTLPTELLDSSWVARVKGRRPSSGLVYPFEQQVGPVCTGLLIWFFFDVVLHGCSGPDLAHRTEAPKSLAL